MKLLDKYGKPTAEIISQEKLETNETVYNFEVQDFHTYHIGELGVWVHNADCCKIADELYEDIRQSTNDVSNIANETGIKPENIQKVKDHVFYNEHLLDKYVDYGIPAERKRFDSNIEQAEAWKRLENGTYTQEDITWLKHETAERWYENKHNSGYSEAHDAAESKWPGNPWSGDE